ncbi:hypothetical protein DFH07DRAFT_850565 [Mycena maculata]|uniref:Uncharacterized protein n=1 Tax=Mycena maculata TaxID=230809 RepID=A0AAD7MR78_9AGAR|nr:hypothetical protein DFH07DRAFT_850565 [Mycena maculata]
MMPAASCGFLKLTEELVCILEIFGLVLARSSHSKAVAPSSCYLPLSLSQVIAYPSSISFSLFEAFFFLYRVFCGPSQSMISFRQPCIYVAEVRRARFCDITRLVI